MSISLSYGDDGEAKQQLSLPPTMRRNGLQPDGQGCCSPERQELGRGIDRQDNNYTMQGLHGKGECLNKLKLRVHIQEEEEEKEKEEEEEEEGRESEMHTQKAELVCYLYQSLSPISGKLVLASLSLCTVAYSRG